MLVATTTECLAKFRYEVDDESTDAPLWSDTEAYSYMSEAADKVAKDVEGGYRLINLPITAEDYLFRLSPNVLHIRGVRVLSTGKMLTPANYNSLGNNITSDYGITVTNVVIGRTGSLCYYVRDYAPGKLLLVPAPVADDTLEIECTTTQAIPLEAGMVMPFMDTTDQRLLLTWMKKLAYEKQDSDTMDLSRAELFEKQYKAEALERKSALRSYRRTPGVIQMEGW